MDSRGVRSQVHENDDSQQVTHGAEEHHSDHEKKSVVIMNKVKAKAKKIKDTIKKHGQHVLDHGNGNNIEHQHTHTPDDHDLDEEDKETVEDPEVHETQIYDSEAVKTSATAASEQVENLGKSGIDFEGSDEIKDITAVEESFERMTVRGGEPTIADTEYPPAKNHDQFVPHLSAATKTQNEYPQETLSTDINRNSEIPSETRESFNTITNTVEKQSLNESVETQSKHKSYTDEIEILPTTADETHSPENSEASRLGYDEKGDRNNKVETHDEQQETENASNVSGSTAECGKNTANSLTEKLAPVYEKVAEVGSAVKSKVYGTSTGSGGAETETKNGVKDHHDKGVSVKDYLAEKLRPGEEDKALSEVISEALHKQKEEPPKKDHGELVSGDEKSEKVCEESHANSPGKGVVDKVKGYVGSWFAKSGENQSPHVAGDEDLSKNKDTVAEGERVSQVANE